MAVAFHKGYTLTQNDLKILIRDGAGALVDPYYIRYSLYDYTTGLEVLIGDPNRIPATTGTGQYYAGATLPLDANIGDWLIRWNFRETPTSPLIEAVQEFNIVGSEIKVSVTGSPVADLLVKRLRILLRDNNPDRNYRFRPPSSENFMQSQAKVFGYIWEDEELYEYILMAIDDFNTAPPVTGVSLTSLPDRWRTAILLRAGAFACFALAANWIADEFSIKGDEEVVVKDDNGEEYSLTIEELYSILNEDLVKSYEEEFARIKEELYQEAGIGPEESKELKVGAIIEIASEVKEAIKRSYGSGNLLIKSYSKEEKTIEWCEISGVMRHNSLRKDILRIDTEIGSVSVTEDHSLFDEAKNSEVRGKDIKAGDRLICCIADNLSSVGVLGVNVEDRLEFTYDLSVPKNENFFLKKGILAHNSYSVSGVSLDIDKSAKYESLKNNYIQEYDKIRDLAKSSIKITKGLKQPRYGVGISSALGPYSRPGVQSRRNYVGG